MVKTLHYVSDQKNVLIQIMLQSQCEIESEFSHLTHRP